MSLLGTLDTLNLSDLFELLAGTKKTGALHVRGERGLGIVYFSDGKVCAGEAGDHSGPVEGRPDLVARLHDVCFELFRFEGGSFEFEADRQPAWPVPGEVEVAELVAETRRRLEEWHDIQLVVPSIEARPRLVPEAPPLRGHPDTPGGTVTLDADQWRVITGIDGRRKVNAIIRVLDGSEYDVCKVLAGLVRSGLVELDSDGSGRGQAGEADDAQRETRPASKGRAVRSAPAPAEEPPGGKEEAADGEALPPEQVAQWDEQVLATTPEDVSLSPLEQAARAAAVVEAERQRNIEAGIAQDGLDRGAVVAFLSSTRKH